MTCHALNIINATLPKGLHTQTNALWHLLLSWGSKDGEKDLKIATQCWLSRQQDPSRMHREVLCLALGGEGWERKNCKCRCYPLRAYILLWKTRFWFVNLSRQSSYLGPKEHESSKILINVTKRKSCGQIILQITLGKAKHCFASQNPY